MLSPQQIFNVAVVGEPMHPDPDERVAENLMVPHIAASVGDRDDDAKRVREPLEGCVLMGNVLH